MIAYDQALSICRTDPEAAARMLCELSRELELLRAEVAALKAENATLRCECQLLRDENAALRRDCQSLRDEVQALKEKTAKDSHNSSKPPSSDGLGKPKPKSRRPRSQRPTGGQSGHPGQTLQAVEKSDHTVHHPVERCAGCGQSLADQAPDRIECRQVFDLPEQKLEVTEHQAEVKTCACGCVNRGAFPPEAAAPVQYGPRIKGIATYLKEYQLLPFERLTEILRDILGCPTFSEGTLANLVATCSRRLEPIDRIIHDQALRAAVAGFDETGVRAVGSLHWLHTVSTEFITWYFAHKRRGREAMDAAGILPAFKGQAVHDFWIPYLDYDCGHAFCNAHLLRELIFLWEEQDQAWAKEMLDHLLAIKMAVDTAREAGHAALPTEDLDRFRRRYLDIVNSGYLQNPAADPPDGPPRRGRRKQSKARNLLDRFRDHPDGILAFMHDFAVPFDNNLSERDLRMMKLRQKISGTFRSLEALQSFCRIRSYVATARKHGLNALDALRRVFAGDPFVPALNTA
jgi:transposase